MLVGAVLTGGASRRMGRTKALVEVAGIAMAERVATALSDAGCDPVVLYGGDPSELGVLGHPVLPDLHPGDGPLGGIVGVLEFFRGQATAVLVVACDLAYLSGGDLRTIVDAAADSPQADAVVATTGRIEPACALWRTASAGRIRAQFDAGERAVHRALAELDTLEVPMPVESLRNINTPDDLDRYP